MICVPLWVIGNVSVHMSHQNASMAVPLWVIGNVSMYMSHGNALWLSLYGSSECLHGHPFMGHRICYR
ncbi:hypothetical protein CsSME_00052814 [Camellia sinensis var. sinensis]